MQLFCYSFFIILLFGSYAFGQSTEQLFPTPVFENQISGEIVPRAIGDSRQTTHFYTFNGAQGDLFVNLVTSNLNADIDIFIEQGLRPLTKIVVYADRGETETGRVIYLRRPEKLLLRIQGRTPNDDVGRYQLKFAGGFVAAARDTPLPPDLPTVAKTPIADEPDPTDSIATRRDNDDRKTENAAEKSDAAGNTETKAAGSISSQGVNDRTSPNPTRDTSTDERSDREEKTPAPRKDSNVDPMANFDLVVVFTDGSRIERPMVDVVRFQVNNGTLTIVSRRGGTSRYSMADVVKVSIE